MLEWGFKKCVCLFCFVNHLLDRLIVLSTSTSVGLSQCNILSAWQSLAQLNAHRISVERMSE